MTSAGPPAAKPTRMRTGFVGYGSAAGTTTPMQRSTAARAALRAVALRGSTREERVERLRVTVNMSLQPLRRFVDEAEVAVFLHVEAGADETEVLGHVDVLLQRLEVRLHL